MSAPGKRLRVNWSEALLRSPSMPDLAVRLGLLAASYGDPDGSRVWPSTRTLAVDLGLLPKQDLERPDEEERRVPRKVERAHALLVSCGWLVTVEDPRRRYAYRLAIGRDPDLAALTTFRGGVTTTKAAREKRLEEKHSRETPADEVSSSPSISTVTTPPPNPADVRSSAVSDRRYRLDGPSISAHETVGIGGRPEVRPSPVTNAAPNGAGPSAEHRADDRRDGRDLFDISGRVCLDCGEPAEQQTDRGPTCMRCLDARISGIPSSAPFVLLDHDRPAHHPSEATP